jgi:hypothetical protein
MLDRIKAGCFAILTIAACLFLWDAHSKLTQAQANLDSIETEITKTLTIIQTDLNAIHGSAKQINGMITDIDRTVQIAGGVLNITRQIERDNRTDLQASNTQTLSTLKHVDGLVVSFDASQKQAAQSIEQTTAALIPVMWQTQRDLAALEPSIQQSTPLLAQATAVTSNANKITADMATEIHKFVYPPPRKWYQKYIFDPVKTMIHLITIPIGHA